MHQRLPTQNWQSTGGCAGLTQHLEIKRNHQLNKNSTWYGSYPVDTTLWCRDMDTKGVGWHRLQTFEMMCLRKILGVTRMDRIRNTSIRQTPGIKNTSTGLVANKRLRYFGHVKRIDEVNEEPKFGVGVGITCPWTPT